MKRSTGEKGTERNKLHLGSDGLSYAFTFDGGYVEPRCDFCGRRYASQGIQVSFKCGPEICPSCLTAGPQVVADRARRSRSSEKRDSADVLGRLNSFAQLPGGIHAMKIAEAFRESGRRT